MRLRFWTKIFLYMIMDCFFHWLSWVGAVFVATALFVIDVPLRQLDLPVVNQHIVAMIIANVVFFTACGVYKSLWQHSGIGTMIRITTAVMLSTFAVYVAFRLYLGFWVNPGHGVMAFYFLLTLSLVPRVYKRVLETLFSYLRNYLRILPRNNDRNAIRTLVIGAGESASGLMLHTSQQGARPREILGILDNDPRKHGYALHGVTVLGGDERIPQLVKDLNIDEIIVAVPSMGNEDLRRIVRLAPVNRCKVRLLSGLSADKASDMLREVNITDLLGRHEAELNTTGLNAWISKKVVMVTGGGGSIGSELCRQLLQLDVEKIVIYEISENNAYNLKEELKVKFGQTGRYKVAVRIGSIQDETRLDQVFNEFKPSVVFHAAAYKHVPLMEDCPRLAIDNNVLGTYRTAKAAIRYRVERFVMISTDKAVNPTNVMGASKRMAELATLGLNEQKATEFVCVRFGNVLDSNGSVIPVFKRQIEAGGPVTVMHPEIVRYFMTITEAARLVLEAGVMAAGGEIFILDMGEQIKIVDLAENLIRMAGLTPDVDIKIEFVGLRPGEKLYEELLLDAEGLTKTVHDKIFVIRPLPAPNQAEFMAELEEGIPDGGDTIGLIKRFVPEYQPDEVVEQ
ncbi:MAG: polysaccharide biosynthesis protein [Firmicutes bacterium]|nr:polysaccharide biosynthesis protein [Bacillota bacterium]